ncbi:RNA polymerase sigma factor [Proteiniphilum sp. X52]|uniref:RNA polymerase sigma factor n=1 Tax=Proteiniphilum sp. X52 TaxID=2382159 RepID=UPI0013148103|nr:RNA polymerase sigma factor [Proteiniphilum sp. X52]
MDIVEYKRIVVALRPSLLAVARRITGNAEDAEDVVQDVCLKIWHFRDRIDRNENMEAYSTTMVRNLSIDKIRSRKPFSDELELLGKETGEHPPDSLLEEKEERNAIRRIIEMLPPLQQRILRMKDLEGFETVEISEMTGIATEAVRNNLSRARKRIRELYLIYYQTQQTTK